MKRAFTIAEFIICIMMMFIVMSMAITIPLKKAKQSKPIAKSTNSIVCSCDDEEVKKAGYECRFTIDKNDALKREFYTIQLLGGGAAGSKEKGGAAGSVKTVYYPSLPAGDYLIKLGQGGIYKKGDDKINGGTTSLYKINDDKTYELLEYALGGVASKERIVDADLGSYDDKEAARKELEQGKNPTFSSGETIATLCAKGGDKQTEGKYGEVVIRW